MSKEMQNVIHWITCNREWKCTFQECDSYEEFVSLMNELNVYSTPDNCSLSHSTLNLCVLNDMIKMY